MKIQLDASRHACSQSLRRDEKGAVLIETAIVLPIVVLLILGIVTYAGWFMAAHSIQQAANDAARAALAGLDVDERKQLVKQSIIDSVLYTGTVDPDLVTVSTDQEGNYFKVTVRYDVARSSLFSHSLVPLPGNTIERDANVQLNSL